MSAVALRFCRLPRTARSYRALRRVLVRVATFGLVCVAGPGMVTAQAGSSPIDLNEFFYDAAVTISADGGLALLTEDEFVMPTVLVNDPFVGDAQVIVAAPDRSLRFDFVFSEAEGNDDEFTAILFDASADGGPVAGELAAFVSTFSQSGTVSFDLSAYVGMTLGLYFELFDISLLGLDSTVEIADLRLVDTTVVPLPAAGLLFACGLVALMRRRRPNTSDL